MTSRLRALRALALALASLTAAGSLAAQQPAAAAACPIELMQPQPVGIANLQRTKVLNAKTDDEAQKATREATRLLFDPKAASNAVGRDYLLAQFFALAIEHGGDVQTRGMLGLPGDKDAKVDLFVALDSLLTIVEKADPACKKEVDDWRQYKPFINSVQGGYKALQANKTDEAERLAKRALILYREGPQPYDILWRVAKDRKDIDGVVRNLDLAISKLAGDTLNANVRANLMFNLGREQQDAAQTAQEPKKSELLRGAAKTFAAVAKEYPSSEEAPFALNGISIASAILKDPALGATVIDIVKGALDKFSDISLAQAGVLATSSSKTADAVLFFGEASKKNPYSRDYLYNYAAMLYESHQPQAMLPVVSKLVAIDPSNPDNVMLFAYAYKGLSDTVANKMRGDSAKIVDGRKKALRDSIMSYSKSTAARKKAILDSVQYYRAEEKAMNDAAAQYRPAFKALTDSTNMFAKLSDDMPHKLLFTSVDRLKDKTLVEGEVENRAKTARTFTIEFEFLGKDGASLGKQSVTTDSVAPGASGKFKVEFPKGGVLGVKYAPLPLK
ncbi:MAG: hypothetical protein HY084_05030 [Gemmatimonadetes bacterium]|nr:hypothetical protein [Gemmatimonadota bacterium]